MTSINMLKNHNLHRTFRISEELPSILYSLFTFHYFYNNLHEIKHIAAICNHLANAFAPDNPLELQPLPL
jgi:hypothetical protein